MTLPNRLASVTPSAIRIIGCFGTGISGVFTPRGQGAAAEFIFPEALRVLGQPAYHRRRRLRTGRGLSYGSGLPLDSGWCPSSFGLALFLAGTFNEAPAASFGVLQNSISKTSRSRSELRNKLLGMFKFTKSSTCRAVAWRGFYGVERPLWGISAHALALVVATRWVIIIRESTWLQLMANTFTWRRSPSEKLSCILHKFRSCRFWLCFPS